VGESGVNSREMVERIWHEVALREALAAEPLDDKRPPRVELHHDMERHYLNAHCMLDHTPSDLSSAGRFPQLKSRLKRRAAHFVVGVLNRYFTDEQEFLAHLVRFQNNLAERHDELGREVEALHHMLRVESQALKQRIALLNEAVEGRQLAGSTNGYSHGDRNGSGLTEP
jgi:hypothetical protein